ncbi:hypothetical protein [Companilactobacillus kedongensis]|uniref:hypothetical protein n=1 Tax=Companilactobacillus kedongensis TaxID=2486004 RepID=UPI000F7784EF|nr:hypothetical protein [Companilactobacillus kedongensis]
MDIIQNLNLIDASQLLLIAVCCYIATGYAKTTRIKNTYMPFISMVVGVLVGLIVAKAFGDTNFIKAGIAGFLVGGWTAGLFTGIKGALGGYELESSSTKVDEAPQLNEVTAPKYDTSVNTRRN